MIIYLVAAAFLLIAAVATYYGMARKVECQCPVPFAQWMVGLRCERHGESTEAGWPETRS